MGFLCARCYLTSTSPYEKRVLQMKRPFRRRGGLCRLQVKCSLPSYDPEKDITLAAPSKDLEATPTDPSKEKLKPSLLMNDISDLIDLGESPQVEEEIMFGGSLEEVSTKRLKCICRSYGLVVEGSKRQLIERILNYEKTHDETSCWRNGTPSFLNEILRS